MKNKLKKAGLYPVGAHPTERQLEWMKREKSIFFHFGINTFTDLEWGDGTEDISKFNPEKLDCRQWIRTIKQAGFTSAIITAKHHDGFCLWQTKYSEHSIKNTPYKNGKGDIVREFTDACAEYGIKAGIYLSPWDRNSELWGREEYNDYYAAQLTELMTNYGKIWECWWDGAGSDKAHYDWGRWAYIVRNYQPDCVIFGSHGMRFSDCRWVGNENGIAGNPCWSEIEPTGAAAEKSTKLNSGDSGGSRFLPAEADVSIRPGWFYHTFQDKYVKTPSQLLHLWFDSCGRNAFILLNLPPNRDGLISDFDVESLLEFDKALKRIFAVNLAVGAKAEADSERESCPADNILDDDTTSFYAAEDNNKTPVIKLRFKDKVRANCLEICEAMELGHRVREFVITAYTQNGAEVIDHSECIGYRHVQLFDTAELTGLDIKILKADAAPVLTKFGLYMCDETIEDSGIKYETTGNLMEQPGAEVTYTDNEIIMDLGGTFPYNTVTFDTKGIKKYEVHAFNGCIYDKLYDGEITDDTETAIFETISYSYRLKITVTDGTVNNNDITVRYVAENDNA